MNQQEKETVDYLAGEETDNQDFFQFADLDLTDEQLAEIKGGPGGGWGCHTCDYSNHNETTVSDETEETEEDFFRDLSLTDEQLTEVRGGQKVKIYICPSRAT